MLTRLVPKVFFNHMSEGLDLFVGCLGFEVLHQDGSLAVVARDGAKAYVVESPEYAAKDRPEIALETDLGAKCIHVLADPRDLGQADTFRGTNELTGSGGAGTRKSPTSGRP